MDMNHVYQSQRQEIGWSGRSGGPLDKRRTSANIMRGTPEGAPAIRRCLDEVAVRLPSDELGHAMYKWFEEATKILEDESGVHDVPFDPSCPPRPAGRQSHG